MASLQFSTLLVDPPRAGLDPQTVQLLAEFDRVVYVSCNPGERACGLLLACWLRCNGRLLQCRLRAARQLTLR